MHYRASKRTKLTDKRTHDFLNVDANRRAVKQLSQLLGPHQLAWLDMFGQYIRENDTKSDCDDVDGVPRDASGLDVLGLDGIDGDDESH